MSQVESTLRCVGDRLLGNRNWRHRAYEDWDFRHEIVSRHLAEQEAREIVAIVNQDGITTRLPTSQEETGDDDLNDLDADFFPEDYDVDPNPEPQQQNPHTELEELYQQEGDEQYDNNRENFTDAELGAVTFDTDRTPSPARPEDLRWHGLRDDMDAMQNFCHGEIQEHEIHLDGISMTHLYHAARTGIVAVDRFDLYGDRNPPAWWPILESA